MAGNAQAPDAGESSSRAVVGGRNLPVAIAVGVVMAGLFLASLFWDPLAFTAVVAVVMIVAYVESHRVLTPVGYPLQLSVLLVAALALAFGTYLLGYVGQLAGILVLLVGTVLWQLIEGAGRPAVRTMSATVFFGLWVGFLGSFAVLLVQLPGVGPLAVIAVIGAAIFSDIGGYAFGVTLGRHKLAPRVSPNKTWEGLLGGLLVATAAGAIVLPLLDDRFTSLIGGIIAGSAAIASVIGDLAESMVKRDLGVKDLGDVLPGHGGVLDRVDGILFALPVGYVAAVLVL
jgi:phosphatidate cytidylyltransferase